MASIRPRHMKMGFRIHEEEHEDMIGSDVLSDEDQGIEEEEREEYEEEHDDDDRQDDESQSDTSEESQENIEPAVLEDMDKFRETFKGISSRFRLINRIGEGMFVNKYTFLYLCFD